MLNKALKIFGILVIGVIIAAWWYMAQRIKAHQPYESGLGYYGPDTTTAHQYQVADFRLVNQFGDTITRELFGNKIWVTDFFFTTCDGICPIMTTSLRQIQDSFATDTNVLILSHTVDPTTDDVSTLKAYAERYGALPSKWHMVTGTERDIYHLARYSYFVATPADSSYQEDFVHSQLIALIDPHYHIRGYYDGTLPRDMTRLAADIRKLKLEYPQAR